MSVTFEPTRLRRAASESDERERRYPVDIGAHAAFGAGHFERHGDDRLVTVGDLDLAAQRPARWDRGRRICGGVMRAVGGLSTRAASP